MSNDNIVACIDFQTDYKLNVFMLDGYPPLSCINNLCIADVIIFRNEFVDRIRNWVDSNICHCKTEKRTFHEFTNRFLFSIEHSINNQNVHVSFFIYFWATRMAPWTKSYPLDLWSCQLFYETNRSRYKQVLFLV